MTGSDSRVGLVVSGGGVVNCGVVNDRVSLSRLLKKIVVLLLSTQTPKST